MSRRPARYPDPVVGQRFGRWVVVGDVMRSNGERYVEVACECGGTAKTARYLDLANGSSTGCVRCWPRNPIRKHGDAGAGMARLYSIWIGMRRRCYDVNSKNYPLYGGAGISVDPAWENYPRFRAWALTNGYAPHLTLDRIDGTGNYTPSNCRWATLQQQARNRSTNVLLTAEGETKTVADWADDPRVTAKGYAIRARLKDGWSVEEALFRPPRVYRKAS